MRIKRDLGRGRFYVIGSSWPRRRHHRVTVGRLVATSDGVTMADAINTGENPHPAWPIEELCCSFHFPVNYARLVSELRLTDAILRHDGH